MIITAGKFKGRKITAPDENITRPTLSKVRMSVFNTLQAIIEFDGNSFLDMYAGSGIMGLEALSRGFSSVTAIEKNPKAASIIKSNFKKFYVTPSPLEGEGAVVRAKRVTNAGEGLKLILGDSLKITPKLGKFDVIYIDPPYFSGIYEKSLQAVKNIADEIIILEHVNKVDFQGFETIKQKKYGDKFITFLKP